MGVEPAALRPSPARRTLIGALAALLLVVHFALAVGSKWHESTTSDEIVHLTAGVAYWKLNDYRLHPENGNLPQRWATLPTWLAGARFPSLDQPVWATSDAWVLGHQFLYESGADHFPRLMAGRAMIALFSVATGLLVFAWSRSLFGAEAGLVSLGLYAFCPTFLAHGALATSDVCMTFFFVASIGAYWRHLRSGTIGSLCLSAIIFGLACVAKFSAVLLLPMFGLIAAGWAVLDQPPHEGTSPRQPSRGTALLRSSLVHAIVAFVIIWTFYGFRYSAANPALPAATQFIRRWDLILPQIGWQGRFVALLARLHALPEAFLYGYSYVIESAQSRSAFLNGEYSLTGWRMFFPWTFLLKTPLPVLIAGMAVGGLMILRWAKQPARIRGDLARVWPLAILFLVYWAFSIPSRLNIGHRHIMPTYPVVFIAVGSLGVLLKCRARAATGVSVLVVAAQAVVAGTTAPHFLAYFNPIAGGPAHGYRHLVDSSLDWGQDLPGLKQWLAANVPATTPVYLSYFGTGEPDYYHLNARRLVMINGFRIPQPFVVLEPGVYCISATALQHVYSPVRGPWTIEYERAFQQLRVLEPAWLDASAHPEHRADWQRAVPNLDWDRARSDFEELRFARLCYLLRAREPDATIGYSILIYRLSSSDILAATGDFPTWQQALLHALNQPAP